MYNAIAVQ